MIIIFFLFGLIIGSFLNVCIYRIPAEQSINFPPSHCTNCQHKLGPMDLLPVVSYLFLKGQCRYCKTRISMQYPLIEMMTGGIFAITISRFGVTPHALLSLAFFSCLLIISVIDIRILEIPNAMVMTLIVIACMHMLFVNPEWTHWKGSLLGVVVSAGSLLFLYGAGLFVLEKEIIGMGDIKLFVPIGLYLGMEYVLLCLYIASVIGGLLGMFFLISGRKKIGSMIPFGPFIALAVLITTLHGGALLSFYYTMIQM